ncbi:MAG: DUF4258 domain-containing protein [Candidatus Aenigmarchaeota archaeon]|nr:DUF4258 domain-containing protein [Candidatus Aenigmarchaeota archaeon]
MENGNGLKKRIIECIERGIELDKEGHAELRMNQRKIKFDDVKKALKSFGNIQAIKTYKPEILKDAYRMHIKIPGKKTLAVGIILEDKCIVKTVFVQSKKIQKKVEKWQKKSK